MVQMTDGTATTPETTTIETHETALNTKSLISDFERIGKKLQESKKGQVPSRELQVTNLRRVRLNWIVNQVFLEEKQWTPLGDVTVIDDMLKNNRDIDSEAYFFARSKIGKPIIIREERNLDGEMLDAKLIQDSDKEDLSKIKKALDEYEKTLGG